MSMGNSVASSGRTVVDDAAAVEALRGQGLSVHSERCVRVRNRHATCRRCADACTSGAIFIEDGQRRFRPELCVGCGTCATMCPTCALEAQHPSDSAILRGAKRSAAANGGVAWVACQQAAGLLSPAAGAVEVICLSRIEESLLFSLAAAGVRQVRGLCGNCDECPRKAGVDSIRTVQRTAKALARAWGVQVDYQVGPEVPDTLRTTADKAPSRAAGSAVSAVTLTVPSPAEAGVPALAAKPAHVQKDGTLPHFVPTRRLKLLDALEALGSPVEGEMDTRLWGHVTIDFSRCRSCKMCAVFCPTGAICKYRDQDGAAGIEHYLAECVHCRLCEDICPADAIECSTCVPTAQLAAHETERYPMADPDWSAGPDQILQRMRVKIGGQSVEHSY